MWAFILLWFLLTFITAILILTRSTIVIYLLFCFPILITFFYFIFKNDTHESVMYLKSFMTKFEYGGHRGSPLHAPENTLESFRAAKQEGVDVVEFDVQMSSDRVPVLMHDDSTGRTSNLNAVIDETTWEALETIKLNPVKSQLKKNFNLRGIRGKIVSLNDTIDFCLKNNLKMIFDIKNDNIELIKRVAEEIGVRQIYGSVLVSSFNPKIPWRLKKIDSRIVTGLTLDRSYYSYRDDHRKDPFTNNIFLHWWNEVLDELNIISSPLYILPRFLGVDVLMMSYRLISEDTIREAKEKGFSVIGWTVNDPDYVKIMRKLKIPFLTDVPYEINFKNLSAEV